MIRFLVLSEADITEVIFTAVWTYPGGIYVDGNKTFNRTESSDRILRHRYRQSFTVLHFAPLGNISI